MEQLTTRPREKATKLVRELLSPLELQLIDKGYWCCYSGMLIFGENIEDYLPIYGEHDVNIICVSINNSAYNPEILTLNLFLHTYIQNYGNDEDECKCSGNDEYKGYEEWYRVHFTEGRVVHIAYGQLLTITNNELHLWAPPTVKPAEPEKPKNHGDEEMI